MEANPYTLGAMWAQSDWIIKGVAILLLIMSIASWTVIVVRALSLFRLKRPAQAARQFWHTTSYAEGLSMLAAKGVNPYYTVALEGQAAVEHHQHNKRDLHGSIDLSDWLAEALRSAIDDVQERFQSGMVVLASVGSTAPFVGLFGTVWGIYHALIGMGVSGQATIDKVAGPVGEALVMTAFGLAVAIPAVLGYNTIVRGNRASTKRLNQFARQLHAYHLTGAPIAKAEHATPVGLVRGQA